MYHINDGTLVVGCGPTQMGTTGATHQVTDGTGTVVTVPSEPKRIVPVARAQRISCYPLVDPSRVAAVGTVPKQCARRVG